MVQSRNIPVNKNGKRRTHRMIAAAALLTMLGPSLRAQTVNPDAAEGKGYVEYVGRFGEVFKLRSGETIDPFVSNGAEVINLYPPYRKGLPDGVYEPFRPKSSDFAPENFTRLELIQLAIIPRSSDSFHSIDELKKAKIRDLETAGVRFKVFDHPHFDAFRGDWPAGSFEISVQAPYRLTQLYTATSSYLCILTSGVDTPPSTSIEAYYGGLRYQLAVWLVPQERPAADDNPSAVVARGITFHPFAVPAVWLSWAVLTGLSCLLLSLGIEKRRDALRRAALSVLIFSNAGALIGGALGLALWPFAWFSHHSPLPAGAACLLLPVLALSVSRFRGEVLRRRAMIGASVWALAAAALMAYGASYDWGGGDNTRYLLAYNAILGFVCYAIGGVVVGVLDSGARGGSPLTVLLALLVASPSRSQIISSPETDRQAAAQARLKDQNVTEETFMRQAQDNVGKVRILYDFQRVEMRGILSPKDGDNDTNGVLGPMFDLQVAPTHLASESPLPYWMQLTRGLMDFQSLNQDAQNQLSEAAEAAIRELNSPSKAEVNEMVAHSWGTEIVYNAILAGLILPPRRLIVCGMPDSDVAKWTALAKYTGTKVFAYTNSHDPAAGAARAGQAVDTSAAAAAVAVGIESKTIRDHAPGDDAAKFELQWADACAQRATLHNVCNPHKRPAADVAIRDDDAYKNGTHDRFAYYSGMMDQNDLPVSPSEAAAREGRTLSEFQKKQWFPGSAPQLKLAQDTAVKSEAHRLYEASVWREAERVDGAQVYDGVSAGERTADYLQAESVRIRTREQKLAADEQRRQSEAEARAPWEALKQWVGMACLYAHPGPADYDGERQYLRTHFVIVNRSDIDAWSAKDRKDGYKVSSCERELIGLARDASGPLDAEWVIQEMDYRRGGGALGVFVRGVPKVIAAIPKGIGYGIVSLGDAMSAPDDSGAENAGSRNPSYSARSDGDRSSEIEESMRASFKAQHEQSDRDARGFAIHVHEIFFGADDRSFDGRPASKVTPR